MPFSLTLLKLMRHELAVGGGGGGVYWNHCLFFVLSVCPSVCHQCVSKFCPDDRAANCYTLGVIYHAQADCITLVLHHDKIITPKNVDKIIRWSLSRL